jgi:hypothetical protein
MWKWDDKAPGMFRRGHPVAAANMPPEWHRWTAIRKGHLAEVARLQTLMRDPLQTV